ncbi:MAG TPA: cytochrome c3 family protein [Geobacteraceae bacterium]
MPIKLLQSVAAACLAAILLAPSAAVGKGSIITTPHNLSASGQYAIKFTQEVQICIFCHVPHNATPSTPLWSRNLPQANYIPYASSTLQAQVSAMPTGASRLCLSCHDGTIALNNYATSPASVNVFMPTGATPTTNPNLTTDLSDDHPISFIYDTSLVGKKNGELALPSTLPASIRLDGQGALQCTACHDPHDNEFGNFLVMSNSAGGSPLCVACHKNNGWPGSTHNPANVPVLAQACMNCHYSHNAPEPVRLLHYKQEENNCYLNCHNGTDTTSVNVVPLFAGGMHRHPVDATMGVHDEKESLPAATYHVECVDCHNPHQVNGANAPLSFPPGIDGRLSGVRKDNSGAVATSEYEICFKCHAGINAFKFSGVTETPPNRMIPDPDQKNRFSNTNPSIHPVTTTRTTTKGAASLKTAMIQIYCSDCHNSDQSVKAGGTGANGPHGSNYPHILIARYDMPLVPQAYATIQYDLCYRCHLEGFIMGGSSGFVNQGTNEHVQHVQVRGIPCFVCHDPHGVPNAPTTPVPGGTTTNNAHLINFNKDYAAQPPVTSPLYTTNAPSTGTCTVSCHTTNGGTHGYQP